MADGTECQAGVSMRNLRIESREPLRTLVDGLPYGSEATAAVSAFDVVYMPGPAGELFSCPAAQPGVRMTYQPVSYAKMDTGRFPQFVIGRPK